MSKISKTIANILCGVLCVGAVAGAGAALYMGGKNNGWFDEYKKPDTEQSQIDSGENETVDGMVIAPETTVNQMRVMARTLSASDYGNYGVSAQAENAYTLTAEVFPDYASDKSLNWSVSWLNPSSAWADGKTVTDYVTITPTTDGALTAVCACLQDFGEPVILMVSSRSNPEVCGLTTVHYYQRIKSLDYSFKYDGEEVAPVVNNGVYKVDYTGAAKDYTVELKPVFSSYTLTDTYTTTVNGSLSSTFGYKATESLTDLKIPAGLSGGDPELTENALNWCNYVKTMFFEYAYGYDIENCSISAILLLGNDADAHGHTIKPKYKLTEEEKNHPRCAYYISLLKTGRWQTETAFNQLKAEFYSYQSAAYNYYGAQVSTYNDFVSAAKRCSNGNVGVIQYSVKIAGTYSTYEAVLNLGYNDEFKVDVQGVNMSDIEVAF